MQIVCSSTSRILNCCCGQLKQQLIYIYELYFEETLTRGSGKVNSEPLVQKCVQKVLKKQWFSANCSVPHEPFLALFLLAPKSCLHSLFHLYWIMDNKAQCSFLLFFFFFNNLHLVYYFTKERVSQYQELFFLLLMSQRYF